MPPQPAPLLFSALLIGPGAGTGDITRARVRAMLATGRHMRDELGIDQTALARPMQAAWISAASFASFAVIPIAALLVSPTLLRIP
jgi:hypothetical protein